MEFCCPSRYQARQYLPHAPSLRRAYKTYPKPLLADYDIATNQNRDLAYRDNRVELVTKGYKAPEIANPKFKGQTTKDEPDVWSTSMVAWTLMHTYLGSKAKEIVAATQGSAAIPFLEGDVFPSDVLVAATSENTPLCSHTLHDLVKKCLQINPAHRPGFLELRKLTKAEFVKVQRVMGSVDTGEGGVMDYFKVKWKRDVEFVMGGNFVEPEKKRMKAEEEGVNEV